MTVWMNNFEDLNSLKGYKIYIQNKSDKFWKNVYSVSFLQLWNIYKNCTT